MTRPSARDYARAFAELRRRSGGANAATLLLRLAAWRLCRVVGLRPVVRIHDGCRMRLTPARGDHGLATAVYLLRDAYEPSVRAAIDATLSAGDCAVDVGANIGLWTLRMAQRVGPQGMVMAFEPAPATMARLAENLVLSGQSQVRRHAFALGAEAGEATLHIPADAGSASLGPIDEAAERHVVPVRTLDSVWREAGSPPVSLMKIDAEGAEPLVLRGAASMIDALRPVTCCEINPPRLAAMGFTKADVIDFFACRGYVTLRWDPATRRFLRAGAGAVGEVEDVVFAPDGADIVRNSGDNARP